jgi:ribosomal protein S18 acetylase RimI-like enzyme
MTPVRVRPATPADAVAMGHVQVESWRAAYAGILSEEKLAHLDAQAAAARWRTRLADATSRVESFVAEHDGHGVVGYTWVGRCRQADEPAGVGEMWALYAAPHVWGLGVGHALFRASEQRLGERGYQSFILWVLPDNRRARRFYERQGMSADGGAVDLIEDGVPVPHLRYRKSIT